MTDAIPDFPPELSRGKSFPGADTLNMDLQPTGLSCTLAAFILFQEMVMFESQFQDLFKVFKNGSKDVTLRSQVCLTQAMVFSVASNACKSWTGIRKTRRRTDAFEPACCRGTPRTPSTPGKLTNPSWEVQLECCLEARKERPHLTPSGHVIRRDQPWRKPSYLAYERASEKEKTLNWME